MTAQVASKAKQAQQGASKASPVASRGNNKPQSKPWLSAFGGSSKGTDAAGPSSSSAPSLEEAADTAQSGLASAADNAAATIQKGYFEVTSYKLTEACVLEML